MMNNVWPKINYKYNLFVKVHSEKMYVFIEVIITVPKNIKNIILAIFIVEFL